ncbi:MAG: ABC transporter permease, partial [Candidatus Eremiobacteraeota bacterium]|nr:ABC transporter permease [Candidatus Eremiobacteraeota bacterium]
MLAIAALTLHEASRRRVVLAALAMGLALVALTGWGFWKLKITAASHNGDPAVVAATIAIFVVMLAYMFSVALAIGAAFLAAPALASDVESGVLLAILPRPIRRADVVLGKWIGLTSLVVSLVVAIGGAELIVVKLVTHYTPPHPATALAYLCGESAILLTLALALSTRFPPIASGIVAIALFGLSWIAGIAAVAASALGNATLLHAGTVISLLVPSDAL